MPSQHKKLPSISLSLSLRAIRKGQGGKQDGPLVKTPPRHALRLPQPIPFDFHNATARACVYNPCNHISVTRKHAVTTRLRLAVKTRIYGTFSDDNRVFERLHLKFQVKRSKSPTVLHESTAYVSIIPGEWVTYSACNR